MYNLDISDSVQTLCDYLASNKELNDFCKAQFNKKLTVFGGDFLRRDIPSKTECPYIILTDFRKHEGLYVERNTYQFTIYCGVSTEKLEEFETDTGVVIPDVYDVCSKFMTLIQKVLNERDNYNRPIATIDTNGAFPVMGTHWAGRLVVKLAIEQNIGMNHQETI